MTAPIARFQVNGIEIGSLPRDTYDNIVQSVRGERRLYVAYAVNIIGGMVRALRLILRCIPLFLFTAFVMLAVLDPESFTSLIAELRTAEPAQITQAVRTLLLYTIVLLCVLLPVVVALSPSFFSIRSPFSDAISRRIRSMLEVPTEGDLTVTFYETAPEQRD